MTAYWIARARVNDPAACPDLVAEWGPQLPWAFRNPTALRNPAATEEPREC